MGYRISFIAADMPPEEMIKALDLQVTGEVDEMPEGETDFWVAKIREGHSILWSENEMFGAENEPKLNELSRRAPVLCCTISETVMSSSILHFADGKREWEMHWRGDEGPVPDNFSLLGAVPSSFRKELAMAQEKQNSNNEVDYFFEVPVTVAEAICGFRYDADLGPEDTECFYLLEELTQPKRGLFSSLFGKRK